MPLQRLGALAALCQAATFIIGFALYLTVIESADYASLDLDPVENARFLVEHEATMYAWNVVIYLVFGVALVGLTLALADRYAQPNPLIARASAAFGLIWAGLVLATGMVANVGASVVIDRFAADPESAGQTWLALHFVSDGLGGGNELVGGIWLLLLSVAMRTDASFSRGLAWLGFAAGGAGVLSTFPPISEPMGAIFGLGLIAWYAWVGIGLLRPRIPAMSASPTSGPPTLAG